MTSTWLHDAVAGMQEIQAAGSVGWLIFIGLYAAACLFFVPGSVLMVLAGAIYGFWGGIFLSLAGNSLGAVLSLLITRYLLRDWVANYLARHPAMAAMETAAKKEGWKIVCLMHLSPIMPFSLINYAFALTTLSTTEFLLATVLGTLPSTFVYVYLGTLVGNLATLGLDIRQHQPIEWMLQGLGLAATLVTILCITRATSEALKKRLPAKKP